jgi:hypothetical protein
MVKATKGGYGIIIPEAWATEEEREMAPLCIAPKKDQGSDSAMALFRTDEAAQRKLWDVFVRELCKE